MHPRFVERAAIETAIQSRIVPVEALPAVTSKNPHVFANQDVLAYRYADKLVYVWRGARKGRVGRIIAIGGDYAQICIGGTGVHTIKRAHLMRYDNNVIQSHTTPD